MTLNGIKVTCNNPDFIFHVKLDFKLLPTFNNVLVFSCLKQVAEFQLCSRIISVFVFQAKVTFTVKHIQKTTCFGTPICESSLEVIYYIR